MSDSLAEFVLKQKQEYEEIMREAHNRNNQVIREVLNGLNEMGSEITRKMKIIEDFKFNFDHNKDRVSGYQYINFSNDIDPFYTKLSLVRTVLSILINGFDEYEHQDELDSWIERKTLDQILRIRSGQ